MTILTKLGEIFGSLNFAVSFGFLIVFIALANFTQYNTLQPVITNEIENQLTNNVQQNQLDFLYLNLTEQCKTSSTAIVQLDNNNQADLKCDEIKNSNSSNIPHLIALSIFNQTYYKNYECSFLECVKGLMFTNNSTTQENQSVQIILTAKANDFFTKNQIFLEAGTVLGIILIIASVRVWYNILKIIGVTLLLAGIIYLFVPMIKGGISNITQNQNISNQTFTSIIDSLFAPISSLLKISLIIGLIFTIVGYLASYLMAKPKQKTKSANVT
jgi:hypothetical protein